MDYNKMIRKKKKKNTLFHINISDYIYSSIDQCIYDVKEIRMTSY